MLGVYPAVTLAKARADTLAARELIAAGTDPGETRKAEKQRAAGVDAFEAVAREWHTKFAPQWSATHANKLIRRLEHVFPSIGRKPVAELTAADVLPCCANLKNAANWKPRTASAWCRAGLPLRRGHGPRHERPDAQATRRIQANKAAHMAALTDPRDVGAL